MILRKRKLLEKQMVSYRQLRKIKSKGIIESFVWLEPLNGALAAEYQNLTDMTSLLGSKIPVRTTIRNKLLLASQKIHSINKNWRLLVSYGYRTPEIQSRYFWQELEKFAKVNPKIIPDSTKLYEEIHRKIAIPTVAGHPTGGAVDVCLVNKKNKFVNCGSTLYDFNDTKRYSFTSINKNQKLARFYLRSTMMSQGFAPFDGEWWHFSYGDKEWAAYYNKPFALYDQVDLELLKSTLQ